MSDASCKARKRLSQGTVSFFKSLPTECRETKEAMPDGITHCLLDGAQYCEVTGEALHRGYLSLANPLVYTEAMKRLGKLLKQIQTARHQPVCMDERKSIPNFPFFVEIDLDTDLGPIDLHYYTNVIKSEVPPEMIASSGIVRDRLGLRLDGDFVQSLSHRVVRRLHDAGHLSPNAESGELEPVPSATWLDVLEAVSQTMMEHNEDEDLPRSLLMFVSAFVHIAFARVIQRAVHGFYDSVILDTTDSRLTIAVLTNQGPDALKKKPPKKVGGVAKFKMGSHMVMPFAIMDQTRALCVYEYAIRLLKDKFPGKPDEFWRGLIDVGPVMADSGGMRMPYCAKSADDWRWYGPTAMLIGDGSFINKERWLNLFYNKYEYLLLTCSLRTDAEPLEGFDSSGKPEPVIEADPVRQLARRIGDDTAEAYVRRLCADHGVQRTDPKVREIVRIVNLFASVDGGKTPKIRKQIPLAAGDPRREAINKWFPELARTTLHPKFESEVDAAYLVYEGHGPAHLYIFPKRNSPAAGECYNRDPGRRGYGQPGRHSSCKHTYFRLDREGKDGRIMLRQMCSNPHVQFETRLNAQRDRKASSCKAWAGYARAVVAREGRLQESVVNSVRDCFFLPHEQTDTASIELANANKAIIKRRYNQSPPMFQLCGPTSVYTERVRVLIKS